MKAYADPTAYWESRLSKHFDLTGAGYAALGPVYNMRMYEARLRALERALSHIQRRLTGATVLEVGCGTGFYTDYCAKEKVARYVGVDLTSVSVEILEQRHPGFRFLQADITEDVYDPPSDFDIVLAADVLYHIVDDIAFGRAVHRLRQALKPGGLLIISDVFPPVTGHSAAHVRLRSLFDYEQMLRQLGLEVKHLEPIFVALQPPVAFPHASLGYRAYVRVWGFILRLTAWQPFEAVLSSALAWIDEKFLLRRMGKRAHTVKWLLADDLDVA